jgi:hypothetical protein
MSFETTVAGSAKGCGATVGREGDGSGCGECGTWGGVADAGASLTGVAEAGARPTLTAPGRCRGGESPVGSRMLSGLHIGGELGLALTGRSESSES